MNSSDSDDSDGLGAPLDFERIERIRESVRFDDCVEKLAINDYQEWKLLWRLPGLLAKNYHDPKLTGWMVCLYK